MTDVEDAHAGLERAVPLLAVKLCGYPDIVISHVTRSLRLCRTGVREAGERGVAAQNGPEPLSLLDKAYLGRPLRAGDQACLWAMASARRTGEALGPASGSATKLMGFGAPGQPARQIQPEAMSSSYELVTTASQGHGRNFLQSRGDAYRSSHVVDNSEGRHGQSGRPFRPSIAVRLGRSPGPRL